MHGPVFLQPSQDISNVDKIETYIACPGKRKSQRYSHYYHFTVIQEKQTNQAAFQREGILSSLNLKADPTDRNRKKGSLCPLMRLSKH